MDKWNFYKTRDDRKYKSIVNEYRRYYVTGKAIKFKFGKNRGDEIFKCAVEFMFSELDSLNIGGYDAYFSGKKLGDLNDKLNLTIVHFEPEREIIIQYNDEAKNLYRIALRSDNNKSKKCHYEEWVKKDRAFFGTSDSIGKIWMWKRVRMKAKLIKQYINKKIFDIGEGVKIQKINQKSRAQNLAQSVFFKKANPNNKFVNSDLAAMHDPNMKAPDESKYEKRNEKLKAAENINKKEEE